MTSSSYCLGLAFGHFPVQASSSLTWTAEPVFLLPFSSPLPRPDMHSPHPVIPYSYGAHGALGLSRTMLAFHLHINTCQYLSPSWLYPVISCMYYIFLENCATKYFSTFPSPVLFFLYIVFEPGRPFFACQISVFHNLSVHQQMNG